MRNSNKIILISFVSVCTVVGFMIKLPKIFHQYAKELHSSFYLIATLFFIYLFPKKWLLSSLVLVLFGIIIEFTQEFSNKISIRIIGKAIHGRFDIVDVKYNIMGVFYGLSIFFFLRLLIKSNNDK